MAQDILCQAHADPVKDTEYLYIDCREIIYLKLIIKQAPVCLFQQICQRCRTLGLSEFFQIPITNNIFKSGID